MPALDGLVVVLPIYDESITGADLDCDEILDAVDADIDGDGVNNDNDAFPLNPSESADTDGDGIGNNADTDDDNDGTSDVDEVANGTDPLVNEPPSASGYTVILDVNKSTVVSDWLSESAALNFDGSSLSSTVVTDGSYGSCVITGDSVAYLKTTESKELDTCVLSITDGVSAVEIVLNIDALYWKGISVGYSHTTAIKNDGTLWAWGYNLFGQLGDGTTTRKSIPTQESTASSTWSTVSAGKIIIQ